MQRCKFFRHDFGGGPSAFAGMSGPPANKLRATRVARFCQIGTSTWLRNQPHTHMILFLLLLLMRARQRRYFEFSRMCFSVFNIHVTLHLLCVLLDIHRTQAAHLVALRNHRRVLLLTVRSVVLQVVQILTLRREMSHTGRRALCNPGLSPVAYLLCGGNDRDYIISLGFNKQSFWRIVTLCRQADPSWRNPQR